MKYLGNPQSGSEANLTASRNRYGQYYRSRVIPTNPGTTFQTIARLHFGNSSALWKTLSADQKNAWAVWSTAHPIVDSLGQTQILSGQAAFVQVNANLAAAALPLVASPPITADAPALASASATWVGGVLSVSFSPSPITNVLVIYATGIVSPGRTIAPGNSHWKRIMTVAAATASPVVATTGWVATWGTAPAVGQVTFVGVRESANNLLQPMIVRRVVAT